MNKRLELGMEKPPVNGREWVKGLFSWSSRQAVHFHYSILDAQLREKAVGNGF